MLDINNIRLNLDKYIKGLERRKVYNSSSLLNNIIKLDDQRKKYKNEYDKILNEQNKLTNQIKESLNKKDKINIADIKSEIKKLKTKAKSISENLNKTNEKIQNELFLLPNIPNETVPSPEAGNQVVYGSDISKVKDKSVPHWEISKKYDLIDFELGNKIAGAGFPLYKGKIAKLQRALVNFFLDNAIAEGYKEVQVPLMINEASAIGTGQLPDKEGMMYKIENEDLYLIPTAEVPITNIVRNSIVDIDDLPLKYVGYSSNFRKEAGSWGSHVRGLNRLHQFDKVEIVQIEKPSKSYKTLENMCQYVENLLKKLELPYRKLKLSADDLGFTSAMTYDLEVFSAGQKKWLEVSSISNFETFQANRLKLRSRDKDKNKIKPHTLNGSAIALPRVIAALIENNFSEKGIKIPKILIPYTGFEIIN